MKVEYTNRRSHKLEIGILLSLIGTQISRLIQEYITVSGINLTYVVFFVSLLLVTDFGQLRKLKIYRPSKIMTWIFIYNLYVVTVAILQGASITGNLIFTLYVLVLWFCYSTNRKKIDGEYLIKMFWLVSGIGSLVLTSLTTTEFSEFGNAFGRLDGGGDRLTLSWIAFAHLCVLLIYRADKWYYLVLKYLFAICAIYDAMACSRKGLMVGYILVLIYHLWRNSEVFIDKKKLARTFVNMVAVLIVLVFVVRIIYEIFPGISTMVISYFTTIMNSIEDYFGISTVVTTSGASRNDIIKTVPKEYLNSSFKVILFGHGYWYQQLDVPYIEAFNDLGLIGGVTYLIVQLFYPVKSLRYKTKNTAIQFAQYLSIITLTYNIYTGVPYGHYKFTSLLFLAYVMTHCGEDVKKSF